MRTMRLLATIALTLLRAKLRQSIVAAVGVMFSIAMFVTLLGFMNGLNELLDGLILNRTPHVRLYNELRASAEQPVELAYADSAKGTAPIHHFIRSIKPKDDAPRYATPRPSWMSWRRTRAYWPFRQGWWHRCSSTWVPPILPVK